MGKYIPSLLVDLASMGNRVEWASSHENLTGGDYCFYLSYGRIVSSEYLTKFKLNLVVHASNLPQGRGWSPASWQILERKCTIPVTLLAAEERVDSGPIYAQKHIEISEMELIESWRRKIAKATHDLITQFVGELPTSLCNAREQSGDASYYAKRGPRDSRVLLTETLESILPLFQIADNEQYPVFFEKAGKKMILKIFEVSGSEGKP